MAVYHKNGNHWCLVVCIFCIFILINLNCCFQSIRLLHPVLDECTHWSEVSVKHAYYLSIWRMLHWMVQFERISRVSARGGPPPPLSTTGGILAKKKEYIADFAVISAKTGHFKHSEKKLWIHFFWGWTPRPPTPFGPLLSNIPGENPD